MTPSASWGAAAALFDHSVYSAITVAWDSSCGGCDNDTTSSTNLAAAKASFVSFFNAVGGITNYYGFLAFFSPGAARVWPSGKPRVSRGRAGYSDERDIFTTDSQRAD